MRSAGAPICTATSEDGTVHADTPTITCVICRSIGQAMAIDPVKYFGKRLDELRAEMVVWTGAQLRKAVESQLFASLEPGSIEKAMEQHGMSFTRLLVDDPTALTERPTASGLVIPAGKREETDAELRARVVEHLEQTDD